jgi:hypothetical protein
MAEIDWKDFEPSTFDAAKKQGRPLLLVITQPWCQHCKNLLASTFASPEIAGLIERSFLPIRVDAERRPDVNERYGIGSWPAIAYLTPGGELISNDGFLTADQLAQKLRKIDRYLATHGAEIEAGLKSLWSQKATFAPRSGGLNQQITDDVVNAIYDRFDHRYGGFGEGSKFAHGEAIDFALVQAAKKHDDRMREVVTVTLDRMAESPIHDRIDGGFFRFSKTPDWRSPNHEKVLDANAMHLRCYLEAFQCFGKSDYRDVALGIVRWMLDLMSDAGTGGFFASQDADSDYYALDRDGRAARQPPKLDRTIYTNWNAMTVSALLKASVVLDRFDLRERAMAALEFLLANMFDRRDGVFHYWDGSYHLPGILSDQAYLIRALIDASQHSGNADLLLPAEAIAEMAIERQKAPGGGFFDILYDHRQYGSMRRRNRSILENSVMAEALLRLSFLARRPEFHDVAVKTLEAFTGDYKEYGYYVAGYGRAVDLIFYEPLVITVVGDRESEAADTLRRTALTPYVPSRIVQMLDPKHDPVLMGRSGFAAEDRPVAYLELGHETRAVAHTPDEVLHHITALEAARR